MARPKPRRCAIYTRKSSEEGLEQDFNSLHAQREACEAFIKSQAHEGWRLVGTAYDDGGISGATMERPGLQRLLEDIGGNRIDTVVVYKVDRLTRSLADFAKMVELFDAHGVSFVAVTQQFNTTSSMGRLTLNVLLSFAQFEREVTGERIRDKIAASKQKGMWMGGNVPLGYDVRDRKLVVNPIETATVRHIFSRYAELGAVRLLKEELDRDAITSKIRATKHGGRSGGRSFSRGALYLLLANPIYIGKIRHKKITHAGQHEAIIDQSFWERVQRHLADHRIARKDRTGAVAPSLLAGRLFDEEGERLTPSHAVKNGRRYRYYVSRGLIVGTAQRVQGGWRLPAREIEQGVVMAARAMLDDRSALAQALREAGLGAAQVSAALDAAAAVRQRLVSETELSAVLPALIDRVDIQQDGLLVALSLKTLATHAGEIQNPMTISRLVPMQIRRRGTEMRLVIEGAVAPKPDAPLLKAIARAHGWFHDLSSGRVGSLGEIAEREGINDRYVRRLLPLAFLAPEIVETIAQGLQPADFTAETLTNRVELPLAWIAQKQSLGFA